MTPSKLNNKLEKKNKENQKYNNHKNKPGSIYGVGLGAGSQ